MITLSNSRTICGVLGTLAFCSLFSPGANAAVPAGYYDQVDANNSTTLRNSLHEIIDDHTRFPYTSSATDTWDILETADQDPDNANNVIDIYKNASYPKAGGGNNNYNREHSWPKSYGFPDDGSTNYAYTDTHHLFISDSGYNSSRSNKPYDNCDSSCSEKTTEFNNNRGATSTQSNWTTGSFATGKWETWSGRRGDVARALMYMAVRYEGGSHSVAGVTEPDLILTDDRTLIGNSNQGSNINIAYMGLKSVLLQWHNEDPVDDFERRHNDTVYGFQGNRNPFVDHPEYVACVFQSSCSGTGGGDTTPPAGPTNLSATGGVGFVELAWSTNTESDLAGYNVYRANSSGGNFTKLNVSLVNTSAYSDNNVSASTSYFYKVSAVDNSGNESVLSSEVSATTESGGTTSPGVVWINEIHYDNVSSDINESVEIAGTQGTDLSGWTIVAYNGNGGKQYKTFNVSGTISNQQSGFGVMTIATAGLQNGAPDGLALVDASGTVVQFLSYEGVMTATDGPASGQTSLNIGVSETSSTPAGHSLQLSGTGGSYADYTWQASQTSTFGSANNGQTFSGGPAPGNQAPVAAFNVSCNGLVCDFDASSSVDSDGSIVSYDWALGDASSTTGVITSRMYGAEGNYSVTLTVTDNGGETHSATNQVSLNTAPQTPGGLSATGGINQVSLVWTANGESDIAGYNLYRSGSATGSFSKLNSNVIIATTYTDSGLADGVTFFYKVTAVDSIANESVQSSALSATTDSSIPAPGNLLQNGVPLSNLSAVQNTEVLYTIDVPQGATNLNIVLSGGTGDADLYVKFGSEPSTSSYDCRPYQTGNNESCAFATPTAGKYYVKLIGFTAFDGATLTATYTEGGSGGSTQGNSVTQSNVSASQGQWQYFTIDVPAGMSTLTVTTSGGTGDADLYVRSGAQPTTSSYNCRPFQTGNNETCTINNPAAGTWHVGVRAYSTFSGVTLNMAYQP